MGFQGKFVKTVVTNQQASDIVIPSGTSAQRPGVPQVGAFRLNTSNAKMEFFNGTEFKTISNAGFVGVTVDSFTGDNSTTTFSLSVTPNDAKVSIPLQRQINPSKEVRLPKKNHQKFKYKPLRSAFQSPYHF